MFEACRRHGQLPGTNAAWTASIASARTAVPLNAQYAYVPHAESKPYFDMAHEFVVADRMFQSQLDESFVAHQYVDRGAGAIERRSAAGLVGLRRQEADVRRDDHAQAHVRQAQRPCFDYETLGDELDDAGLTWRFYTSTITQRRRLLVGLSGGQAYLLRTGLGETSSRRRRKFLTDVKAGKLANFTWITPLCNDSDHPDLRRRLRTVVGRLDRQRGRREQVLELDRDLRAVGRLGRLLRSRAAAVHGLRRPRLPRSADRDLAVRQAELRLARAVRIGSVLRFAEDLFGLGAALGSRYARDLTGRRLLRLQAEAATFVPIKAPKGRSSSCISRSTRACPTRSEPFTVRAFLPSRCAAGFVSPSMRSG